MEACALNDFYSPAQRARFLNAVSKRRSVRAYKSEPDVAQLSALQYAAARVCLPGVRIEIADMPPELLFRRLPVVGGITGTEKFAAVIADTSVPRAGLLAGISGEAFILEATGLDVGTCWVASFRRKEGYRDISSVQIIQVRILSRTHILDLIGKPEVGLAPRTDHPLISILIDMACDGADFYTLNLGTGDRRRIDIAH